MDMGNLSDGEESFVEFRRRVRSAEVLSSAMERLLQALNFTGRLSVVVQNGRILKSGYEEAYFTPPGRAQEGALIAGWAGRVGGS